MKYRSVILFLLLSFAAYSQNALHGLFTPIRLQPDTTYIYLRDFFADEDIRKAEWPLELINMSNDPDTLILLGKMSQKMAPLHVITSKGRESILLINSSLQPAVIQIPAADIGNATHVKIIGDFNNWNRGVKPIIAKNGNYTLTLQLEPGKYAYKLLVDGREILDPVNPRQVPNGFGSFNNILEAGSGDETVTGDFNIALKDSLLKITFNNNHTSIMVFADNRLVEGTRRDKGDSSEILIDPSLLNRQKERSFLRIYSWAGDKEGRNQLIPLSHGKVITSAASLQRTDWHQARMYFLMVDRFKNGDSTNDRPTPDPDIHPKANFYGGDISGINEVLKQGYFDSLHYNTLWLSPITQNPPDAWGYWNKGNTTSKFSAYHGYWPVSNLKVDQRFGSEKELKSLLDNAHERDKNMVLDYVANHVHINHPIYKKNPDWATSLYLPDGSKNTEMWDEHRLTTWFDDHLPTLDLRKWEVVDPLVDSALFWITEYDFDGFRHDATKHIDELFWRTLTYRLKQQTERPVLQIGETYGSPALINSYISTGMLDGQFDFNLYDAAVSAFAGGTGNLHNLRERLMESLKTYGYNHLMGNITGNQDRARFISLASGDVKFSEDHKVAGWDREIGKPAGVAYKKLALLHAFNNAIPGIPCTYYGDEYGLAGAGDPDNRRMMEFSGLDDDEQGLWQTVQKLNELRASEMPLIYGSTETEVIDDNLMIIKRRYAGQEVWILINNSEAEISYEIDVPGNWKTAFSNPFQDLSLTLPPWSFEYIILK